MNDYRSKSISFLVGLVVAVGFVTSALGGPSAAMDASATLSDVPGAGNTFDYTLTLSNAPTATASIEGFWYAWIPGKFFLPTVPSTAGGGTSGWTPDIFSNSIQYQGNAGNAIAPGHSATFTFVSTDTPTTLAGNAQGFPIGDSFAYEGTIDFVGNPPDEEITVVSVVPEPSSSALLIVGAFGLLAAGWRKLCVR
jgi:hypothetical protein